MTQELPLVTVIIPCRNEERHIGGCIESVVTGTYPLDRLEVLAVDGASEDRTAQIITDWSNRCPQVRLVPNEGRTVPRALNRAIRAARGEIIVRLDAHATYEPDYVLQCVRHLQQSGADNVGGRMTVVPGTPGRVGRAIAAVLADPVGVGGAKFRFVRGAPQWADTVPFGCFPRSLFERLGLFDERLTRGQDMDFNVRLRAAGGRILLVPDIVSHYHARGDLKSFVRHNLVNGYWGIYPLMFGKRAFTPRHLIPMVFVTTLLAAGLLSVTWSGARWVLGGIAGLYLAALGVAAARIAWRERDPMLGLVLPLAFAGLHLPYGVGSLWASVEVVWHRLRGRAPEKPAVYR